MFNRITQHFTQQATSFVLAAMITFSMLGGIERLPTADAEVAVQQAEAGVEQVVVITAKRIQS